MKNHSQFIAYVIVAALSIGGSILVTNYSDNKNHTLSVRLEKKRVDALVQVCESNIKDRLTIIKSAQVDAKANKAISNDGKSSPAARQIRLTQARTEQAAILDLRSRVDPAHGGNVRCDNIK